VKARDVQSMAKQAQCIRVESVVLAATGSEMARHGRPQHRSSRSVPLMGHSYAMDDDLVIRGSLVIPTHELAWKFSRSSGPGGQGVNTTDSRVQLCFDVVNSTSIPEPLRTRAIERLADRLVGGCLVITASEYRSQWRNREAARTRLAESLRAAIAPPARPRRPTRPTKSSVDRRIKAKKSRGETKRLRQVHLDC